MLEMPLGRYGHGVDVEVCYSLQLYIAKSFSGQMRGPVLFSMA